jgi:hypothetical protein
MDMGNSLAPDLIGDRIDSTIFAKRTFPMLAPEGGDQPVLPTGGLSVPAEEG